ncbi:TonB-dependent receptor domain-containing protein [Methylobacillus methanolivorans]|uniref:TonB-dependent receptor domain-containing protein n=1 Tax=Methylobacillus methanolivorans TaxID=1848927 RepID=A0ABW8GIY5_9PROT
MLTSSNHSFASEHDNKDVNPAQNQEDSANSSVSATLPEIAVKVTKTKDSGINSNQAITTITTEDLQRTQASNIFEAVRSAPGVSISGGPRPSGMSFSIRGFADNEDVMVKVDGVPKGFEKYRMGGTFIEPELLKSIEVQRGPQISSGSGSLGGTIIATTKNAADLLRPGQRYGAKIKFGYGNNNDEYSRSYMAYGRPHDAVDILYNYSNRQSNNILLANGTKLESSAIQSVSELLKIGIFPIDSLEITTSLVSFKDTGLQPYDATGGQPGTFGNVLRDIDDFTWSHSVHFSPETRWIDLKAAFGMGHTKLHDLIAQDMNSSINPPQPGCNGIIRISNPSDRRFCRGDLNDYYVYKTKSIDISNTAQIKSNGWLKIALLTGYQFNESKREIERFFENRQSSTQTNQYPNGFNASAPPGTKSFHAVYVQPRLEFGQLSIIPGYRRDDYEIEADGGTLRTLAAFNQANKIKLTEETWSLGLSYDLFDKNSRQKLTLYSNYGQGFRPPLIDEYFTRGIFSRCSPALMPNGPSSRICGDLYKPQRSESTEAGLTYQNPGILGSALDVLGKINFFHIHTSNLLLSLQQEADGSISQNGWERRNGVEFESFLQYKSIFLRATHSRTRGTLFDGSEYVPLYTVPGNATNINLGAQLSPTVEVNLTYRKISERNVVTGGGSGLPLVFGIQDGYEVWNAGMRWQPTQQLGLRLIGENLKNKEYFLDGTMGGQGMYAAGRNIKFMVELTY